MNHVAAIESSKSTWRYSAIDKDRLRQMRAGGASLREVAKNFGCSRQYVQQLCPPVSPHMQQRIIRRCQERARSASIAARDDLWSDAEVRILLDLWPIWKSARKIASTGRIKRSANAIAGKAHRLDLFNRYRDIPARRVGITLPMVSILLPRPKEAAE